MERISSGEEPGEDVTEVESDAAEDRYRWEDAADSCANKRGDGERSRVVVSWACGVPGELETEGNGYRRR